MNRCRRPSLRCTLLELIEILLACGALVAVALLARPSHAQQAPAAATTGATVRFRAVDIFVDSKATPLAAYQLEFVADAQRVKLVGIEGGEHAAFREPPGRNTAARE